MLKHVILSGNTGTPQEFQKYQAGVEAFSVDAGERVAPGFRSTKLVLKPAVPPADLSESRQFQKYQAGVEALDALREIVIVARFRSTKLVLKLV